MRRTKVRAQMFPPGDFIREELEARGWSQGDFAAVLKRPLQAVNEIINGKKRITAETAKEIAAALGTSPEVWLNLENSYRLSLVDDPDPGISRRAAALRRGERMVRAK
jgi:HTH-type transcriptional regulator/antitoxin HigA